MEGLNHLGFLSLLGKLQLSTLRQIHQPSDFWTCRSPDSNSTLNFEGSSNGPSNPSGAQVWETPSRRLSSHPNDKSLIPSHRASKSPAISALIDQDVSNYFLERHSAAEDCSEVVLSSNSNLVQSPDESLSGSPRPFGGILTSINTLYSLPIKQTSRNAELLHFCMQICFKHYSHLTNTSHQVHSYVVPNLVSIDGQNVPILFQREILPWMIQSPLMPNIAIIMASATQSSEHECMVRKSPETLSIQSHVFKIINQFLKQDFNEVGGEALRAVIHLAILEVS